MENIKHLNLTEKDFTLIVKGLDALPDSGAAGEMMGDLMISMLVKKDGDPKMVSDMERDREERKRKIKQERELMLEDIRILQGKLLMLKRYLIENNLLSQVTEILR